jgi:hypothetical protein
MSVTAAKASGPTKWPRNKATATVRRPFMPITKMIGSAVLT